MGWPPCNDGARNIWGHRDRCDRATGRKRYRGHYVASKSFLESMQVDTAAAPLRWKGSQFDVLSEAARQEVAQIAVVAKNQLAEDIQSKEGFTPAIDKLLKAAFSAVHLPLLFKETKENVMVFWEDTCQYGLTQIVGTHPMAHLNTWDIGTTFTHPDIVLCHKTDGLTNPLLVTLGEGYGWCDWDMANMRIIAYPKLTHWLKASTATTI
ncbi:hypothetical protein DFS34DRAFT_233839 [Phlyctochytrium arcticum]|nr:hypothetical protein DFS34DRAFT_233839 [Phlyctochytrium arcticum]